MSKTQHDSETPAQGQQVITACAFIYEYFDGVLKVFLPKRAETKKFLPGLFELPGGHIDFGEELEDGLRREVMEEFNKEIVLGEPFAAFTYVNEVKGSHSVEIIYFAKWKDNPSDINVNPEDHSGYEWFAEADVVERREQIVPDGQVEHFATDDPEYLTILKGFEKLK